MPRLLPPDRLVDCKCGRALSRPVLIPPHDYLQVAACLACRCLTVTECIVNEPRSHDVQPVGNLVRKVASPVDEWLGTWPRLTQSPSGCYVPAAMRAHTEEELAALEASAAEEQESESQAKRLRRAGAPTTPPPKDLPKELSQFADAWRGLRLTADLGFEALMVEMSHPWAAMFALPLLRQRPDLAGELTAWLEGPDERRRRLATRAYSVLLG